MRPVYLDHHATTPLDPRVREAMLPHLGERFGNPDSLLHAGGRDARDALALARGDVAALLAVRPDEVVFTSGATEANALAMSALGADGGLVTVATEHASVLAHAHRRAEAGRPVRILPVDAAGRVDLAALDVALATRPRLVSAMLANNEVGTATDLAEISERAKRAGSLVHVDAAQGLGMLPLPLDAWPIDFVSLSAHKFHGPLGGGALFVRRSARDTLSPLLLGGGQEGGLRSGTPNVPALVGLGVAARVLRLEGAADAVRIAALRDRLARALLETGRFTRNGDPARCHPGNLSLTVTGVSADRLALEVEAEVALGTGSACSTGRKPSHVLRAMGRDDDAIRRTVRLGLGRTTTDEDVDRTADALIRASARFA